MEMSPLAALQTEPSTAATTSYSGDILEGVEEISAFIRKTPRQTHYLIESGRLPVFKFGKIWHMRKTTFSRHVERLEAEAAGHK